MSTKSCPQPDLESELKSAERLQTKVRQHILGGQTDKLSEIFNPETVELQVVNQAWDLIPTLCEGLTECSENTQLVNTCFNALNLLSERGNPKEAILALLEQIDTFLPDSQWQGLIKPIQTSLMRLPSKRQYSLKTTLDTLFAHLKLIELPDTEEKEVMAVNEEVGRLIENSRLYIDFMEPFVNEVPNEVKLNEDFIQQRNYLLIAIFNVLAEKLIFLYFDRVNDMKPAVWYLCETIMTFVARLCRDLYKASDLILRLMHSIEKGDCVEEKTFATEDLAKPSPLPHVSVAAFHYLLYCENLGSHCVPSVLTHNHIFEHCLPSIALMFSSPRSVIVYKGAKLALKLLDFQPVKKFNHHVLELKHFTAFMDNLLQAVVMCRSKEVRSKCVNIFPLLLQKFDAKGKHMFFVYSFRHTGHAGVKGHLLHLVKEELVGSFDVGIDENDKYMTEARVTQMIHLLFVLPEGAFSDILEQSDLIINCLNLLRYLVIRDKDNVSGIWNHIPKFEKGYFEKLREGLQYSRGHYLQELENCRGGKSATEDLLRTGIDFNVKVGNKDLPVDIPKDQALSILHSALHTFDLVESLLGRLEELIKYARKDVP